MKFSFDLLFKSKFFWEIFENWKNIFWESVTSTFKVHIFRNERETNVEIFQEQETKFDEFYADHEMWSTKNKANKLYAVGSPKCGYSACLVSLVILCSHNCFFLCFELHHFIIKSCVLQKYMQWLSRFLPYTRCRSHRYWGI